MATGFGSSIQQASDMIYDFTCSPCEDEGLNAEALYYCKHCLKQYCDTCEKFHRRLHRDHVILGRDKVKSWGQVKRDHALELCDDHQGQTLQTYCGDHDAVCCPVCISLEHRSCKVVKHLPDVANGFQQKPEFKQLPAQVDQIQTELNDMVRSKKKNSKDLQDTRAKFISTIQQIRLTYNQIFDDIEKRTVKQFDDFLDDADDTIHDDINSCTRIHDEMKKFLDSLQGKGSNRSDSTAFVGHRKCKTKMTEARNLLQELNKPDYKIIFKEDKEIEKYLSKIQTFGTLHSVPDRSGCINPSTDTKTGGKDQNASIGNIRGHSRTMAFEKHNRVHVYSVKKRRKYNVRHTSDDKRTCFIVGCCQLPNGDFVIVDRFNKNLKLLDRQYAVTGLCPFPGYIPGAVCHMQGDELAVVVPGVLHIQRAKASHNTLTITQKTNIDIMINRALYSNGDFYLGNSNGLDIYTADGKKVRTLYKVKEGEGAVSTFAISDDGTRVYISQRTSNNIIVIDNRGRQLSTFSDPDLDEPYDICVGNHGHVFVCANMSNTVLQLDKDGKKITTVAREADGLKNPQLLCFDRKTSQLLVGQAIDDNILVLDLA